MSPKSKFITLKVNSKLSKNDIIQLLRVKHWIKNLFVFLVFAFSPESMNFNNFILLSAAFLIFSLTSSSIYILNDIFDIKNDILHPKKKFRPIARGIISKKMGIIISNLLMIISINFSYVLNEKFCLLICIYFIMNVLYSFKLKNIVIIDIMIISFGFIVRTLAGGFVINEKLPVYSLLFVFFLTIYISLNKRYSEIVKFDKSYKQRETLNFYSKESLGQMLFCSSSCIVISYIMYIETLSYSIFKYITVVLVMYGIFRFQYLSISNENGDTPENLLLKDKSFLISIFIWFILLALVNTNLLK